MSLKWLALGGMLLLMIGWQPGGLPFAPDALFSDAAVSHWPAAHHLRESVLAQGEFPLWRETIMAGQPFAANPLNKTAYPFQVFALLLPPTLFLNMMIALHVLLAGAGMMWWARRLGLAESSALLSAAAYALAPKVIGHLGAGHLDVIYALAWWPWLMGAVLLLADGRVTIRQVVQVGLCAGLLLLGDVRLGFFALGLAGVYGLWAGRGRILWGLLPGGLLALVLTLSVTVPLLAWRSYLNRGDLTLTDAGLHSLEAGHLLGLLLPAHQGTPETMVYLTLPVLLLAGVALFAAPRQHALWLVALVVALLWALGVNGPLWPLLVSIFPALLWFRVPSRAWFVVVLVMALLAGYGLQVLLATVERLRAGEMIRRLVVKRLAIAGGIGASLFCGGFTLAVLSDLPATIGGGVMVIGAALGLVLLLAFYGRLSPERLALLCLLIVLLDVAWTGRNRVEWRPESVWLTHQQALMDSLQQAMQQIPYARIYSPNYALEQQVAQANDLRLFGGVDPFQLRGVVEAIAAGSGVVNTGYSVVQPPLVGIEADEDIEQANCDVVLGPEQRVILAEWGVRYVVSRCPLELPAGPGGAAVEPFHEVQGLYLYLNPEYMLEPDPAVDGWPDGWGLPDAAAIDNLSQITAQAFLISAAAFIFALLVWGWTLRS